MAARVQVLTAGREARLASALAATVAGRTPEALTRFVAGLDHHVFEATFSGRAPLVIRVSRAGTRGETEAGLDLHRRLRAAGVPLPEILHAEMDGAMPGVVLERLAGADLGVAIKSLPSGRLDAIAAQVAAAQEIVARTASAGRYGYASAAEHAPHAAWSAVPLENLARSRQRITQAGLFDLGPADRVGAWLAEQRAVLDKMPATPFLHDTTTKNVIVTADGGFSGIVDVDNLCFGDPRYVCALTLASLIASGGPAAYVESWMRRAGHADDRIFRLYVALFLVDFMSEHGQTFNGNQPPSLPAERLKLLQAFGEAANRIGQDVY